jgi:dihydropteroate synthase
MSDCLVCGDKRVGLREPVVMGVLNVTPDSFSDGGRYLSREDALRRADHLVEQGAAIIDIGGESSRPGAIPVPLDEELRRVIPVIEALAKHVPIPISVDTRKPTLMRAAVDAGAGMINDITALREPGALTLAASLAVPICLMHMQGEPQTMQQAPHYHDVTQHVREFLLERRQACIQAGIAPDRIVLDPGFGFGKTAAQNYQLMHDLPHLAALGSPLLVGVSRKSMIGVVLQRAVDARDLGSACLASLAVFLGARIIRAHDVSATRQALLLAQAVAQPLSVN